MRTRTKILAGIAVILFLLVYPFNVTVAPEWNVKVVEPMFLSSLPNGPWITILRRPSAATRTARRIFPDALCPLAL
jgi:hypothetical protein